MARMYPPTFPSEGEGSERAVYESLRRLPDDWRVFHSVAWQSRRGRRQSDGEADFIVLSPTHGLLILEVKGGRIDVTEGRWSSRDRNDRLHEIKNPFDQAMKSKYALIRYLEELEPPIVDVPISHGVSFPTGSVGRNIGMYGPRDLILDKADLLSIDDRVLAMFSHWEAKTFVPKREIERITILLAPTTQVRSRLRNEVAEVEAQLLQLTDQQVRALQGLKRWRRAVVHGGPGTGKTVLAVERVKELVRDGFPVLLTCFNEPLGVAMQREVQGLDDVKAGTFHSICFSLARQAGLEIPRDPTDGWWRDGAPELLVDAATALGFQVGAVVVDEAQDFPPSWIDALMMLLDDPDDAPMYVFADERQDLYGSSLTMPDGWPPPYELTINCRSSLPIARAVAGVFERDPLSIGTEGPAPIWTNVTDEPSAASAVQDIVDRLLTVELLEPSQVTVLCDSRTLVDRIRSRSISTASFVELGKSGVVVETVHRFKGLESTVVLLCLTGRHDPADLSTLAYVGMSRAKSMLIVLGSPDLRAQVNWGR